MQIHLHFPAASQYPCSSAKAALPDPLFSPIASIIPIPFHFLAAGNTDGTCGVLQAFREDRTLLAAADFIADALGQRFVESVPLNLERALLESAPNRPLICLLSPGTPCHCCSSSHVIAAHLVMQSTAWSVH